jgi:hypothetical protein
MKSVLITILGFTAACAASSPPPPAAGPASTTGSEQTEPTHGPHHKEGKPHEHKELSPALHDFHGVLAPVWHSDAGATRVEKACSGTKPMQEKAKATSDAELIAAVTALEAACAKDGRPEVEAKLAAVHDRFHAVAKLDRHDDKH